MDKALLLKALDTFEKQTRADWRRYHRIADKAAPKVFRAFNSAVAKLSLSVSVNKATEFLEQGDMANALEVPNWAQFEQDIRDLPLRKPFFEGAEMAVDEIIRNKELRTVALENINKASAALEIELAFNLRDTQAELFLAQNQQFLVNSIGIESKDAVRNVILRGFEEGKPPRVMAREIKNLVGLNNTQAQAITNLEATLNDRLERGLGWPPRKLGLKQSPLTEERIGKIINRTTKRMIRERSLLISQSETIRSANAGVQSVWQSAISEGLLPTTVKKIFLTAGDELVCPFCNSLDGTVVGVSETFSTTVDNQNGSSVTLTEAHPPVHPRCRCAIALEVDDTGRESGANQVVDFDTAKEIRSGNVTARARK